MKHAVDAEYGAVPARGLIDRMLSSQRRKLFDAFMRFRHDAPDGSVLNLYMKPSTLFDNSDYLLAMSDLPQRTRITSHEMAPPGEDKKSVSLPYGDNAFDWVFCNEVLEHAGSTERQYVLVQELYRVARRGVFLTTENRDHPIEFKSGLPLIHLLPEQWWRRVLKWLGKRKWATDAMLNPVDARTLYRFASLLPGKPEHDVGHKRVFGIKAHFFLMISKRKA